MPGRGADRARVRGVVQEERRPRRGAASRSGAQPAAGSSGSRPSVGARERDARGIVGVVRVGQQDRVASCGERESRARRSPSSSPARSRPRARGRARRRRRRGSGAAIASRSARQAAERRVAVDVRAGGRRRGAPRRRAAAARPRGCRGRGRRRRPPSRRRRGDPPSSVAKYCSGRRSSRFGRGRTVPIVRGAAGRRGCEARPGEVRAALPHAEDAVRAEVEDVDDASPDLRERPVAAVGDGPVGAAERWRTSSGRGCGSAPCARPAPPGSAPPSTSSSAAGRPARSRAVLVRTLPSGDARRSWFDERRARLVSRAQLGAETRGERADEGVAQAARVLLRERPLGRLEGDREGDRLPPRRRPGRRGRRRRRGSRAAPAPAASRAAATRSPAATSSATATARSCRTAGIGDHVRVQRPARARPRRARRGRARTRPTRLRARAGAARRAARPRRAQSCPGWRSGCVARARTPARPSSAA